MPVSNEVWSRGMLELALLPSREESPELESLRGAVYRREIQPNLTDHQWRHAVAETVRTCEWFPTAARLLEYGNAAPPPPNGGVFRVLDCETCRGTGFEFYEQDGRSWVKPCACRPRPSGEAA